MHTSGAYGVQKKTLDPLELGLQMVVGHMVWEVNSEPLEEQQGLLNAEPSLQSLNQMFLFFSLQFLLQIPICSVSYEVFLPVSIGILYWIFFHKISGVLVCAQMWSTQEVI